MPIEDGEVWVIWSFEHDAWWAPNRWGYTRDLAAAGRYTEDEADAIVREANIVPGTENERAVLLLDALARGAPPDWHSP